MAIHSLARLVHHNFLYIGSYISYADRKRIRLGAMIIANYPRVLQEELSITVPSSSPRPTYLDLGIFFLHQPFAVGMLNRSFTSGDINIDADVCLPF